jgi:hypothetical protein
MYGNGAGLTGTIPPDMFVASNQLYQLELADSAISGTIPPNIGNMNALHVLKLHNMKLSGSIPATLTSSSFLPGGGRVATFYGNYLCTAYPAALTTGRDHAFCRLKNAGDGNTIICPVADDVCTTASADPLPACSSSCPYPPPSPPPEPPALAPAPPPAPPPSPPSLLTT